MLRTRVFTAIVLLAILLPALFYPAPQPFNALALVAIAAAAWEWGRLAGLRQGDAVAMAAITLALCGAAWAGGWVERATPLLWQGAGLLWVLGSACLLRAGVPGWGKLPQPLRVIGGIAVLWAAWLAMAQARTIGINFLLSAFVLVWVADIGAYFAGRAFGRRKLAPAISPGKSWEGVYGGMAGVAVLAAVWVAIDRSQPVAALSIYSLLLGRGGWALVLGVAFLTAMSVVGDLTESLIKRSAGAKDSSQLLPGHGGVLDRVDALLPTLPLVMMLASLSSQ